jgi:hypothetical protein
MPEAELRHQLVIHNVDEPIPVIGTFWTFEGDFTKIIDACYLAGVFTSLKWLYEY